VAASSPTAGASSKRVRAPPRIWKPEEDAKLTEAVTEHGKNWLAVSALVPGRNNVQCHNRWINYVWPTIEGKNVSSGKWTSEEDAKIIEAVKKCGTNWIEVATGVPGRTKVQCSNRWANLGPVTINRDNAATGKWKKSEDVKMIEAVKKCGKDWVAVAALVPGRTNAQCCRRWAHVGPTVEGRL
jgi:myb proto-oncogene protein